MFVSSQMSHQLELDMCVKTIATVIISLCLFIERVQTVTCVNNQNASHTCHGQFCLKFTPESDSDNPYSVRSCDSECLLLSQMDSSSRHLHWIMSTFRQRTLAPHGHMAHEDEYVMDDYQMPFREHILNGEHTTDHTTLNYDNVRRVFDDDDAGIDRVSESTHQDTRYLLPFRTEHVLNGDFEAETRRRSKRQAQKYAVHIQTTGKSGSGMDYGEYKQCFRTWYQGHITELCCCSNQDYCNSASLTSVHGYLLIAGLVLSWHFM